jgi:hypothetical protein
LEAHSSLAVPAFVSARYINLPHHACYKIWGAGLQLPFQSSIEQSESLRDDLSDLPFNASVFGVAHKLKRSTTAVVPAVVVVSSLSSCFSARGDRPRGTFFLGEHQRGSC